MSINFADVKSVSIGGTEATKITINSTEVWKKSEPLNGTLSFVTTSQEGTLGTIKSVSHVSINRSVWYYTSVENSGKASRTISASNNSNLKLTSYGGTTLGTTYYSGYKTYQYADNISSLNVSSSYMRYSGSGSGTVKFYGQIYDASSHTFYGPDSNSMPCVEVKIENGSITSITVRNAYYPVSSSQVVTTGSAVKIRVLHNNSTYPISVIS